MLKMSMLIGLLIVGWIVDEIVENAEIVGNLTI